MDAVPEPRTVPELFVTFKEMLPPWHAAVIAPTVTDAMLLPLRTFVNVKPPTWQSATAALPL
jgi:hypothetical protein